MEGSAAQTDGGTGWKTNWLATVLGRWDARSATEATIETPAAVSRNRGAEIPDEMGGLLSGRGMGAARGNP
jgi:hypothetical protein